MSLVFKSLSGLETISGAQLANNQRITLITPSGMVNATWGTLSNAISEPLNTRLALVEEALDGASGPSIWPAARTISLTGAVTGSVALDGSQNVSLATSIADGSLAQAKVTGLVTKLDELGLATNNRWGTGYTQGPIPTAYNGNLDLLAGATFLYTQTGASNPPAALTGGQFVILQNGPQNFGQQIGLRNGEAWVRGQNMGAWSSWNKLWTSDNLDPSTLLLKTDTASAATKLATPRSIALTGLVTAAGVAFDGSGNISLTTAIADNALAQAKVNGLVSALALKFDLKGLVPTNTPLNSVTGAGVYGQNVTAQVTAGNNYPVVGVAGVLKVVQQTGYVLQEYVTITNQHWRRMYDNNSWSAWTRIWGSLDFDPTTKYDKTGGAISGNVSITGSVAATEAATAKNYIATLAYTNSRIFGLALPRPANLTSGIVYGADFIGLATTVTTPFANHELKITDAGALLFKDKAVYHASNFDPANPVPTGGLLNIGDPGAANLSLRKDGQYSLDGGTSWNSMGGAQTGASPRFSSLKIGTDDDIYLYEDLPGKLAIRTGSSSQYYYFTFGADGNLALDGRVFISGNEAWHAGNFNPATKLGTTATAAAATKLATARTINGVAFDGTANITLPSNVNPADYVTVVQNAATYTNADDLAGKLAHAVSGSTALGTPTPYITTWNFGTNGSRDGQFGWSYSAENRLYFRSRHDTGNVWKSWNEVWTAASFNPSLKANLAAPTFTGDVYFDVNGTSSGKARITAYASAGVNIDAVSHDASVFAPLNLRGTSVEINNNTAWHAGNFDPASKLTARGELGTSAFVPPGNDWNNANSNGWWMASGATNAPGAGWYLGTVTVHNGDWIQQEVWDFTATGLPAKWRRNKRSGNWDAWSQDWTVGGGFSANRISAGWDGGMAGSISCSNWFRSSGQTGMYFADYGGGWYMTDSTYIRSYNGKQVAAADFVISSDARLKMGADTLTFRGRLNPSTFRWIETGKLDFGFIADEVEELYPEAVGYIKAQDGLLKGEMIKQLSQAKLTAVVAAQANEQGDEIIVLKLQMEQAQRDITELKELVAELRNR